MLHSLHHFRRVFPLIHQSIFPLLVTFLFRTENACTNTTLPMSDTNWILNYQHFFFEGNSEWIITTYFATLLWWLAKSICYTTFKSRIKHSNLCWTYWTAEIQTEYLIISTTDFHATWYWSVTRSYPLGVLNTKRSFTNIFQDISQIQSLALHQHLLHARDLVTTVKMITSLSQRGRGGLQHHEGEKFFHSTTTSRRNWLWFN